MNMLIFMFSRVGNVWHQHAAAFDADLGPRDALASRFCAAVEIVALL